MFKRRKVLIFFLSLMAVLLAVTTVLADTATLGVYFCGVTELQDGSLQMTVLDGSFEVWQDGTRIGIIHAGQDVLTLKKMGEVTVFPIAETVPEGWQTEEQGYTVNVVAGGTTTAPVFATPAEVQPEQTEQTENEEQMTQEAEKETENLPGPEVTEAPEILPEPDVTEASETLPVPENDQTADEKTADDEAPADQLAHDGAGSLTVRVFNDKNNNGEYAKGEGFTSGVKVSLIAADGTASALVSGDDGLVSFTGLAAGKYTLRAELPMDCSFTKKGTSGGLTGSCMDLIIEGVQECPVELKNGENLEKAIGVWSTPHVSGLCWLDENGDGVRQNTEAMLPGVRVVLEGQKNGLVYETASGEDGTWCVSHLKPGFYTLRIYVPDGMMFTRYSATGGARRSIFTSEGVSYSQKTLNTNDGASVEGQDTGYMKSGVIQGICFLDANYNGRYDEGEQPLAGVKMEALKQDGDGATVASAISGEDGTFMLHSLRGRTYKIRAVLPDTGITFTKTVTDADGNHFLSRPGRREYYWENVLLSDAETRNIAVGAIVPATVSGVAYLDNDFSGNMNGRESVVSGLTVKLLDRDGNTVAVDKTNVKGRYVFEGLTPGDYMLSLNAKVGYAFTKPGDGNVILNTSGGAGVSEYFEVAMGANLNGMDLGMILPCTVSGKLFGDANDNGLWDSNEHGLTAAAVHLVDEQGQKAFSVQVNPDGTYCFDAVMPGEWTVCFELPENAAFSPVVPGGNTFASDTLTAQTEPFSLKSGDEKEIALCGALLLGRISGVAFRDDNGNGVMDAEEALMPGVTLTLTPSRDEPEPLSTVSDALGVFSLTGIHPDDYSLTVSLPEGYVLSRTDHLSLPVRAGTNGETAAMTVVMNGVADQQMLGCVEPAALTGRLWLDENNNGLFDEGEATPAGETVTVVDEFNGEVFAQLLTDAEGYFHTDGMIPGSFTVTFPLDSRTIGTKNGDSTFRENGDTLAMTGIQLNAGEERDQLLLGVVRYSSLSGSVWFDQGGSTEALGDVRLKLTSVNGTERDALTGADGSWCFAGLLPDVYTVSVEMPRDHVVVEPDDERLAGNLISIMAETNGRYGTSAPIALLMNQDLTDLDIGSVQPGRIGDLCWLDENGNGWQETDEPGIPGVRIELIRHGETVAETVSDQYGYYRFTEVYPAVYTLRVTPPEQVIPTVRKTDIPLIVSSLTETEENVCTTVEFSVSSNRSNYNVDLGFVDRVPGKDPAGLRQGATQKWN